MDLEKLWKNVLAELELSVSKAIYQTHFSQSRLVSLQDSVATIGFPSALMRGMVESRYYSLLKSVLDHHTKGNVSLLFTVTAKVLGPTRDMGPLFALSADQPLESVAKRLHIRADATFDNFAVSTSNQLAYAAATAVAKSPGTAYNPLFVYGGVGVGKTHLVHAIANSVLTKKPAARIVYCMGEEFLNEIVEAIQTKAARQFKQKYRSAHLLIVDDVQFIAGKQTAQEEFFHTFNAVHREGGQIVLTSDRSPQEISKLEDRLRSRFEGGLIVDISQPDFELRAAIVNIKSLALGLAVPPEAARLVAANITDTRALEGFLMKLRAAGGPVTTDAVAKILGAAGGASGVKPLVRRVTAQDVAGAVASFYDLKLSTLKGPKRDRPIARPRQVIMYLCKTELGLTLEDVGGLLGGRDHTTIMHGVDTIARELGENERLREDLRGIKLKLGELGG